MIPPEEDPPEPNSEESEAQTEHSLALPANVHWELLVIKRRVIQNHLLLS